MNRFQEFFSGEFNIRPDDGHFKIYRWWMQQTGKTQATQVNFCRYFWTVVLKAPLMWFFQVPLYKAIYPWMILTPLVYGTLWGLDAPVPWLPSLAIAYVGIIMFISSTPHGRAMIRWFFQRTWLSVIAPWNIAVTALLVFVLAFGGIGVFLELLKIFGETVATIAGVALVFFLLFLLKEGFLFLKSEAKFWVWEVRSKMGIPAPYREHSTQASGTFRLFWQYISAKKRKICPLVNLPV